MLVQRLPTRSAQDLRVAVQRAFKSLPSAPLAARRANVKQAARLAAIGV
jgi:hypothetical protein